MMQTKKFGCFILTHGRPNGQHTYRTIRSCGYTGPIYLICDNEDAALEEYKAKFGKEVIVFNKDEAAKETDKGDIIDKKNVVVFARNMCHKIARDLGLDYFVEMDDDYHSWHYRYISEDGKLKAICVNDLDACFDAYCKFLDETPALTVCFGQGGDLIGGASSLHSILWKRKAMNVFFCRTDRPFKFSGRINEDVNAYVTLGTQGKLLCTIGKVIVNQTDTQQQKGGLTESYLENGTYVKSFYSVMMCPSAVKISVLHGEVAARIHHKINWDRCVPKILREEVKTGISEDSNVF